MFPEITCELVECPALRLTQSSDIEGSLKRFPEDELNTPVIHFLVSTYPFMALGMLSDRPFMR